MDLHLKKYVSQTIYYVFTDNQNVNLGQLW